MTLPRRIQRKRTKGWRMPPGTVYVGRGSRFGNPFRPDFAGQYLMCDASHRRTVLSPWVIFDHTQDIRANPATPLMACQHYHRWLRKKYNSPDDRHVPQIVIPCTITRAQIAALRGKHLACWCAPGQPCHADLLLHLANPTTVPAPAWARKATP